MPQKIIKVGTSIAAVIPKEIAEDLDINAGDSIKITPQKNGVLIIRDKSKRQYGDKDRQRHITELTKKFIDEYREDLESLADR